WFPPVVGKPRGGLRATWPGAGAPARFGVLQEQPVRVAVEHDPADGLKMRVARLDLMRQGVDVTEAALERRADEDGRHAGGLIDVVGDADRYVDGLRAAE